MTRIRTKQGTFSKKRGDSRIENIEQRYNVDFGVRSDMKLGKFLKQEGFDSLGKALREVRKRKSS